MDENKIAEMEQILNASVDIVASCTALVEAWHHQLPAFKALMAYYGSQEWFDHKDKADQGALPQDLPHGVLSEDAVFDLYGDVRQMALQMITLGAETLK